MNDKNKIERELHKRRRALIKEGYSAGEAFQKAAHEINEKYGYGWRNYGSGVGFWQSSGKSFPAK